MSESWRCSILHRCLDKTPLSATFSSYSELDCGKQQLMANHFHGDYGASCRKAKPSWVRFPHPASDYTECNRPLSQTSVVKPIASGEIQYASKHRAADMRR